MTGHQYGSIRHIALLVLPKDNVIMILHAGFKACPPVWESVFLPTDQSKLAGNPYWQEKNTWGILRALSHRVSVMSARKFGGGGREGREDPSHTPSRSPYDGDAAVSRRTHGFLL